MSREKKHQQKRPVDNTVPAWCRRLRAAAAVAALAMLLACGQGGQSRTETRPGAQSGGVSQSNKKDDAKCLRVVNGTVTEGYEAAVLILLLEGDQVTSTCTGFFVGKRTLLTASHCVAQRFDGFSIANVSQFDRGGSIPAGVAPKEVIAPTIVESAATAADRAYDVAAMVFDNNVAPAILKLASKAPAVGSKATVVGFGQTKVSTSGDPERIAYKRFGINKITSVGDGVISFAGPMNDTGGQASDESSGAAPGDSGGPLLVNGEVVGVVSGGFGQPTAQTINNIFADVNFSHTKELLTAAEAAGGDIGGSPSADDDAAADDECE